MGGYSSDAFNLETAKSNPSTVSLYLCSTLPTLEKSPSEIVSTELSLWWNNSTSILNSLQKYLRCFYPKK